MESKIRIKIGPIEVEYEGPETFLKQELPDLLKTITELSMSTGGTMNNLDDKGEAEKTKLGKLQLSTTSIAAKLSCSSGPELILAAAAHLTLVRKLEVFSRKQLLDEMKTASGYYKTTYRDNLSTNLKTLLKDKLNEPSSGQFSLSAKARKELEVRLAK